MSRLVFVPAFLAAIAVPQIAPAATGQKVCTRHSTVILDRDEKAEVNGAGSSGVELLISGPAGQWIFADYNGLSAPAAGDVRVASLNGQTVVRRSAMPQIYVLYSNPSRLVDGKPLTAFISGLYLDRRPLANPRIKGTDADRALWQRVTLGQTKSCDLRWVPGKGLVK